MDCLCQLAKTAFIVTACLSTFGQAFVLPPGIPERLAVWSRDACPRQTLQMPDCHGTSNSHFDGKRPYSLLQMQSRTATAENSMTATSSLASSSDDDILVHKLIVLEDVVKRLHHQKGQLSQGLKSSHLLLEETKTNLTAEAVKDREAVHKERRRHRLEVDELRGKLENVEEALQTLREKSREKIEHAKEEHNELEAKARKLADQLDIARSKLDVYRKESYQRETKLRERLQEEQVARKEAESVKEMALEEAEKAKAAMNEQKEDVEETLMISEAAVAAADRREATLTHALETAEAQIANLQTQLNATQGAPPTEIASAKITDEVRELQDQRILMHQKFEAERERERQKWAREIGALQEALEIARTSNEDAPPTIPSQKRSQKPNLIRRIRRKLLP